jgi:hypothetical protein
MGLEETERVPVGLFRHAPLGPQLGSQDVLHVSCAVSGEHTPWLQVCRAYLERARDHLKADAVVLEPFLRE